MRDNNFERVRDEATQRIRGRALQKIRQRILMRDPLCKRCEARNIVRESKEVDHVVPLFKGGKEEDENRQGLCIQCHYEKSMEDTGKQPKLGFNNDGTPKDPNHHWNKGNKKEKDDEPGEE